MNSILKEFTQEMRNLTGECFLYTVQHWAYTSNTEATKYLIQSVFGGFTSISKESEEELIDCLPLIKKQVLLLIEANNLSKTINTKLIGKAGYEQ